MKKRLAPTAVPFPGSVCPAVQSESDGGNRPLVKRSTISRSRAENFKQSVSCATGPIIAVHGINMLGIGGVGQ